jgi:hypothetical protein
MRVPGLDHGGAVLVEREDAHATHGRQHRQHAQALAEVARLTETQGGTGEGGQGFWVRTFFSIKMESSIQ